MIEARLASTKKAAELLGFVHDSGQPNTQAFLSWARQCKGFPRPKRHHHLWWDMKAIHQYLDNLSGIQTESAPDYDAIVRSRLPNYGESQSEIRR